MDIGRAAPADLARDLLDELLSYRALYDSLVRSVADCVIELDASGAIVRFNHAAEALTGHSGSSLIGRDVSELVGEPSLQRLLAPRDPHEVASLRFSLRDSLGKEIRVDARVVTQWSNDAVEGHLLAFRAQRAVAEIEQLKSEFVSTVSHELKTPLASIKAYTATLRQNPNLYRERRTEFLSVIEQQADRLSQLIDDMLLVTRIEAGQMLRRRVTVSLDTVLDQALAEIEIDPTLHSVVRHTHEVPISGDPERLRDVFRNVVENAVKYSPGGGTITISAHEEQAATAIHVHDEGIGIADEHLPYIFDRFYRVDDGAPRAGGSGLGLFIVHSLVRAHGGTIEVRSEPGHGSTFTLLFPVRR